MCVTLSPGAWTMSPQRLGSLLCLSLLMVSCSKPMGTGLNEGSRAYRQGDYTTAYAEFSPWR